MIFPFKQWLKAINDYPILLSENQRLLEEVTEYLAQIKSLLDRNSELSGEIQQLRVIKPSVDDANYWNSHWARNVIFYSAPNNKKVIDYVIYRRIRAIDDIADLLIRDFNLHGDNVDIVPLAVMKWLEDKFEKGEFKYVLDKSENWEDPEQTLQSKTNDCDGWGIVEYFVIREIFMRLNLWKDVNHRLKMVVGHVHNNDTMNSYAGLHFYLIFLCSDLEFYTVESTFDRYMAIDHYLKLPQKLNPQYGQIVWTFNEQYSWSQKSVIVSNLDFQKVKKI